MILRKLCLLALLLSGAAYADVIKTIQIGATDQTVTLKVIASDTGIPSTDLAFNSSGIDLQYWRHGANSAVAITEATQTVSGAHSDGGFVHVGAGQYRLDLPDAAVASGATAVEVFGVITGEIVIGGTVQLVAYNPQDSVRLGLTALPNAAADAAGGLVISDAGGLNIDATATSVAAIEVDTSTTLDNFVDDLESRLGTPSDFGSGTSTIAANLQDLADDGTATYSRATDSLQAIRDQGDAAWVTGGGGTCPSDVVCTTVATAPTTTSITATAVPNSDTQLDGWGLLFTDNGDADSYCLREITGVSTGTISYGSACPFTVAASDEVVFLPAFLANGVDVVSWNGTALSTTNPLPNAAPDAAGGLIVSDAGGLDIDVHAALLVTVEGQTDDIGVAGVGLTESGGTGDQYAAVPWNADWDVQVESEANDALVAIHLDHLFAVDYDPASKPGTGTALLNELIESDAGISRYTVNALENGPSGSGASAASIADAVWDELQADHTTVGTFGVVASEIADVLVDTIEIGVAGAGLTNIDLPNQTMNITGTLSGSVGSVVGSVGSVTGAVGSVTGNVGGNVTGSVASVTGNVGGIAGTITTLDALDIAQDTQHGTTQTAIDALPTAAENAAEHLSQQRVLTGTCDSGSTTTCVDNALTQAAESQLDDRLICFEDSWCALITGFTPGSDTVTTTKTAPSTRASLGYTIFPATAQ